MDDKFLSRKQTELPGGHSKNRTVSQLMRKIIVVAVVVPVLALTAVIVTQMYTTATDRFDRDSQVRLRYVIQNIREHDRSNREALSYFATQKIVSDAIDHPQLKDDLIKTMVQYGKLFFSIESVAVGTEKGKFYFENPSDIPPGFDPRTRPWYIDALAKPKEVILTEPYVSTSHNAGQVEMTYAKAILDDKTGAVKGVAASATSLSMVNGILSNVQATDSAVTFICSNKGVVIASSIKSFLGKVVSSEVWLQSVMDFNGYRLDLSIENVNYRIYKAFDRTTGWTVVTMVPLSIIYTEILKFLMIIILVSSVAFIIPYLMAQKFSKDISVPVKSIENHLAAVWGGDMGGESLEFNHHVPKEIVVMGQAVSVIRDLMDFRNNVIDNADIWLSVHDETGAMLLWNPAAEQISGYSSEEVLGKSEVWSWLYPDPLYAEELHKKSTEIISKDDHYQNHITRVTSKNGTVKHVAWDAKKVVFEGGIGACTLALGIDVSRQMEAEETLLHMNADLEYKISERTKDLDSTNRYLAEALAVVQQKQAELESVNERLTTSMEELQETQEQLIISEKLAVIGELVAGMAHEINTPLGISVTLSTFLTEHLNALSADFKAGVLTRNQFSERINAMLEASGLIDSNLKIASQLIGGFKEMAKDQQVQEIRTVELGQYVKETLGSLKPKIKKTKHQIELRCPEGIFVNINPGAVSQIVTNLVINSLVHGFYGVEEGKMSLDIMSQDHEIIMLYKDNGVGIPENIMKDVFKPFFTTKKGLGTTGLGLHILKMTVEESLHGSVTLSSVEGEGVSFEIRFPALSPELKKVFG